MRSIFQLTFKEITRSRAFWLWLSLLSLITGIVFLIYLESYLDQQAEIIKKNIRFGFSDLAMLPYLKITALFSTPVVVGMTANWYRRELNSAFTPLFLCLNRSAWQVVSAKSLVLISLTAVMTIMLFIPIMVFNLFANVSLDIIRLAYTFLMIWTTFTCIGLFSAWLSCRFSGSVWGMFTALAVLGISELSARLITEPFAFAEFLRYLSPFQHIYGVTNGVITLSNLVYIFTAMAIFFILTVAHIRHRYTHN